MLHANFNSYNNYVTDSLYQWDINQDLIIEGLNLSVAPEIHFSNARMGKAIVRQSTLESGIITVRIPNSLLQESLTIKAYIGIYDGDSFKVIESIEIPIIARERPDDYSFMDDEGEIYSFKALENKVENVIQDNERIIESTDALIKKSVAPAYETIYEGDGLTEGNTVNFVIDKYEYLIATLDSSVTHGRGDAILTRGQDQLKYAMGADTKPRETFSGGVYVQVGNGADREPMLFFANLTISESGATVENTIPNSAKILKLVGVTKEPNDYISIRNIYDPESEDAISGKGVAQALSQFEIPENDNTDSGVSEAQRQTLLAVINAIGLFNVDNAQVLLDNFNKAWDIVEPVPATSITLDKTELTFTSEDTQTITATVLPLNTTDVVVWNSSDTSVATVKNGVITPLVDGETIITATAGNVSATCAVTVNIYGEIENPVFLSMGVVTGDSTATSDPVTNTNYPKSASFSAVPVKAGDTLACKTDLPKPKDWLQWWIFDTDGANATKIWSAEALGWDTVTATKDGYIRVNIMGHESNPYGQTAVISEYSVTSNGVKTTYTVVDKR